MKPPSVSRLWACLLLVTFALVLSPARPARAANISMTVDTTVDANDSAHRACTAAADDCSLRGAIMKANADPGNSYTIILPANTYGLPGGELGINSNVVINGSGQATTVIDALNFHRVIQVSPAYTVTITGVTIRNGRTLNGSPSFNNVIPGEASLPGAGIYNAGTLFIADSTIRNNTTGNGGAGAMVPAGSGGGHGGYSGVGGGIYNTGNLSLNNVTVSNNYTGNGGIGGVGSRATETLGASVGGSGGSSGAGAGIYNTGTMTVTLSRISSNITGAGGAGGVGLNGITDSTGSGLNAGSGGNGGNGGSGAGIYSLGQLNLVQTTVDGNTSGAGGAGGDGGQGVDGAGVGSFGSDGGNGGVGGAGGNAGGIYSNGTITITGSTVSNNSGGFGGTGGAGGDGGDGASGGNGGSAGDGGNGGASGIGGIYLVGTGALLENATISTNTAGSGGMGGSRGARGLKGSGGEVDGGIGTAGSGGVGAAGGLVNNTTALVNSSTITLNAASLGGLNGNSTVTRAAAGNGGGLAMLGGTISVNNTILSANTTQAQGPDCFGTANSQNYNLISNSTDCSITGGIYGSIVASPQLGPLGDHGGPTQTHVPAYSSPAIDVASPTAPGSGGTGCPASDGRGNLRNDMRCDIGAVEVQLTDTPTIQRCSLAPSVLYTFGPTMITFQITNPGANPLTCMSVTRVEMNHPHATPSIATGRYWTISANGAVTSAYLSLYTTLAHPEIAKVAHYSGTGETWDSARISNSANLVTRMSVSDPNGVWAVDSGLKYLMLPLVER